MEPSVSDGLSQGVIAMDCPAPPAVAGEGEVERRKWQDLYALCRPQELRDEAQRLEAQLTGAGTLSAVAQMRRDLVQARLAGLTG